MKKIFVIISFFTILFSSCDTERIVYIDNTPINPHMVLNALAYAGNDTSYFYITESRPIYRESVNNTLKYDIIKDATLSLTVNGETDYIKYNDIDGAYIFIGKLKEGDKINIQATHKERNINSVAILPSPPEVISIDTASFQRIENGSLKNYLMFKLKIRDKFGSNDYYRLLINNRYTNYAGEYMHSSNSYYTDDPILKDGYTGIINDPDLNLPASVYNYYSVFRDVRFSDKEYTLTFYVDSYSLYEKPTEETEKNPTFIPKRHLIISLQSISEDLYKYYSSLQRSLQVTNEPLIVHTNINGGLGILGTCNEIKVFDYKNF